MFQGEREAAVAPKPPHVKWANSLFRRPAKVKRKSSVAADAAARARASTAAADDRVDESQPRGSGVTLFCAESDEAVAETNTVDALDNSATEVAIQSTPDPQNDDDDDASFICTVAGQRLSRGCRHVNSHCDSTLSIAEFDTNGTQPSNHPKQHQIESCEGRLHEETPSCPDAQELPRCPSRKSDTSAEDCDKGLFSEGVRLLNLNLNNNPSIVSNIDASLPQTSHTFRALSLFETVLNDTASITRETWHTVAMSLNNMAVAKRRMSFYSEALALVTAARSVAIYAVAQEKLSLICSGRNIGSDWMDLVIYALDLKMELEYKCVQRESEIYSQFNEYPSLFEDDTLETESVKVFHGPPIVSIFLDIMTNAGNILYSMGRIQESMDYHAKCLCLVEQCFECVPMPSEFRISFPLSIPHRFATTMMGILNPQYPSSSLSPGVDSAPTSFFGDPGMPAPRAFRRIHLSYLHRTLFIAQARSLTHLAICCQALQLEDEAMQCNSHALEIVTFYRTFGVFGNLEKGVSPNLVGVNTPASGSPVRAGKLSHGFDDVEIGLPSSASVATSKTNATSSQESQHVWDYCSIVIPENHGCKEAKKSIRNVLLMGTDSFVKEEMDPLKASVLANIAVSYYAKGRLPASLDSLVQSSTIFRTLGNTVGCRHAITTINALKIEIGKTLKNLQWIQGVQENTTSQEYFVWFWDSMAAPKAIGRKWIMPGLIALKKSLAECQSSEDLHGIVVAALNLAAGYLLLGSLNHAFIALHVLASIPLLQTASNRSILNSPGILSLSIKIHAHYILCQAVFLIRTLHTHETQTLDLIEVWPDSFLYWEDVIARTSLLLEVMDIVLVDFMDLEVLADSLKSRLTALKREREDVKESRAFFQIIPYISDSCALEMEANRDPARANFDSILRSVNNQTQPHLYGITTGIGFSNQQHLLLELLLTKHSWHLSRFQHPSSGALELCLLGLQRFEAVVSNVLELLPGSTIHGEFIPALSSSGACAILGAPGVAHLLRDSSELERERMAMLQTSPLLVPILYALCADLMASTAVQVSEWNELGYFMNGRQLSAALKIYSNHVGGGLEVMMQQILHAAASICCHSLGMCIPCMERMVSEDNGNPDVAVMNLWFVSLVGNVVEAESGGGNSMARGNGVTLRNVMSSNGRHIFPCPHYYVK